MKPHQSLALAAALTATIGTSASAQDADDFFKRCLGLQIQQDGNRLASLLANAPKEIQTKHEFHFYQMVAAYLKRQPQEAQNQANLALDLATKTKNHTEVTQLHKEINRWSTWWLANQKAEQEEALSPFKTYGKTIYGNFKLSISPSDFTPNTVFAQKRKVSAPDDKLGEASHDFGQHTNTDAYLSLEELNYHSYSRGYFGDSYLVHPPSPLQLPPTGYEEDWPTESATSVDNQTNSETQTRPIPTPPPPTASQQDQEIRTLPPDTSQSRDSGP